MPTLFILIALLAVVFSSYMKLTGGLDSLARFLYFSGLLLMLLFVLIVKTAKAVIAHKFCVSE